LQTVFIHIFYVSTVYQTYEFMLYYKKQSEKVIQNTISMKTITTEKKNRKSYIYFIKYWIPVIIFLGIIFWMSGARFTFGHTSEFIFPILYSLFPGLSPEDASVILGWIRAFAHIIEYFLLGFLLSRAFPGNYFKISGFKKCIIIIILLTFFALGDELHQSFVPSRNASPLDVGFDLIGGFLSQIIIMFT
jgi:VanZ family protein